MKGTIMNFRGSRRRKRGDYVLISVDSVDSRKKAESLTGKTVNWQTPGKKVKVMSGKVTGAHGNKGVVKARFERGLPGQSLGKDVKIE